MANLTLLIDENLLRRARIRALARGTTVNAVVREFLESYVSEAERRGVRRRLVERARERRRRRGERSGVDARGAVRGARSLAAFLDTNVQVYAVDASAPRNRASALSITEDEARHLVVSAQVLEELYRTVTRKLRPPMPADDAQAMVRELARATDVVAVDASLVEDAIDLAQRTPLALWDAAIVIATERGGCRELLTEDLSDGQEIEGVLVRDPFTGT